MHPILQAQVVKHLTSKGVTLTPEFNQFLAAVDKAYTSCDNDRQAFLESSQVLADAQMISKIGSWTIDTKTRAITWSDELFRIFEVNQDDFKPTYENFLKFVHPDDKDRINETWQKIFGGKIVDMVEFRIVAGNGLVKWLQSRSYPADGQPDGLTVKLIGTLQDVTDRKNLEEAMSVSNERLRMLFDYAPDGYFLISEQGTIIDANLAFENITGGLKREEMIGKNIMDLGVIPPEEESIARKMLSDIAHQIKSPTQQFSILRRDGERVVVESRGYPIVIQGENYGLATIRDITERYKNEAEVKKRTDEMERLNNLMIGRELKMVELKKENEDLKKRVGLK